MLVKIPQHIVDELVTEGWADEIGLWEILLWEKLLWCKMSTTPPKARTASVWSDRKSDTVVIFGGGGGVRKNEHNPPEC